MGREWRKVSCYVWQDRHLTPSKHSSMHTRVWHQMRGSGDRISRTDLLTLRKCADGALPLGLGLWSAPSCFSGKPCSEGGEAASGLDAVAGSYWAANCPLTMGSNPKYTFSPFGWIVQWGGSSTPPTLNSDIHLLPSKCSPRSGMGFFQSWDPKTRAFH